MKDINSWISEEFEHMLILKSPAIIHLLFNKHTLLNTLPNSFVKPTIVPECGLQIPIITIVSEFSLISAEQISISELQKLISYKYLALYLDLRNKDIPPDRLFDRTV